MQELLKMIPNVNNIMSEIKIKYIIEDETQLKDSINDILEQLRLKIREKKINEINLETIINDIYLDYQERISSKFRKCINGTGVIIHTNLGRSTLSDRQLESINILKGYYNLEFNIETQKRGSRYDLVENSICRVTGAEAALVVNNNAAAVMLVFNEFAKDKEVIVSNSELVEIGGSFRIPEVMKLSGAIMKNVGTTNKTKLSDYSEAINDNTGLLAKIHQSNFYIEGFVASVDAKDLVTYRNENNLDLVIYEDLASGAIFDLSKYGIDKEPTVIDSVQAGIDVISFSGDKLLGGVQAGIIIGKKECISRLKKNQLLRALRPSGIILNIVESTFNSYLDEKLARKAIPTFKHITEDKEVVKERAYKLFDKLDSTIACEIIESEASVGGGCMPKAKIPSYAVAFEVVNPQKMKEFLISSKIPIVTLIANDKLIIDFKVISDDDIDYIYKRVLEYINQK